MLANRMEEMNNVNKRNKINFTFGLCKVCKRDQSSGFHYGIATCDGCKVISFETILFIQFLRKNQDFYLKVK